MARRIREDVCRRPCACNGDGWLRSCSHIRDRWCGTRQEPPRTKVYRQHKRERKLYLQLFHLSISRVYCDSCSRQITDKRFTVLRRFPRNI